MKSCRHAFLGCLALVWLLAGVDRVQSCGIDWTVPRTHFDGVDEKGHVCLSEKIDDLDLGGDLKLALIINFRSDREAVSPYLGKGWIFALLDSSFVQTGENSFLMTQPDGWVMPFYRAKAADSILDGGINWKAEIKDETVMASADCGWRLTFTRGKISRIDTPKNRHLDIVYSGGRAAELREQGATKLAVEFDPASGRALRLSYNGKEVVINQDARPRVQSIAGRNVIGGSDLSFSQMLGKSSHYEFSATEKVEPVLAVTSTSGIRRVYRWDPSSRLIASDGDFEYQITPAKSSYEFASIARTNKEGKSESWFRDLPRGREIVTTLGGTTNVKEWFASGVLEGKIRKTEQTKDGKTKVTSQIAYNEKGQIVREVDANGSATLYSYDAKGNEVETRKDGKLFTQRKLDDKGRVLEELLDSGEKVTNQYLADGTIERQIVGGNGIKLQQTWKNGLKIKGFLPGYGVEEYGYDPSGALVKIVDPQGAIWTLKYGKTGEVIERFKDGHLYYKIFSDINQKKRIRIKYDYDGTPSEAWNWLEGQQVDHDVSAAIAAAGLIPLL